MRIAPRPCLVIVAMVGGFLAVAPPPPAPAAEAARVLMVDNEPDLTRWHFEPAEVTVPAGATVVWFNKGKQEHTVTADDKSFDSGMKKPGTSWERTFTTAGRYSYYCAPHPWMKGTVRVVGAREAAEAPAATSATTAAPPTSAPPTTAAPAAAPTTTTFPPSLGAGGQDAPAAPEVPAPASPPPPAAEGPDESVAAPAGHRRDPGGNVVGTTALVVLPTLGALAIGARLRRRAEPGET